MFMTGRYDTVTTQHVVYRLFVNISRGMAKVSRDASLVYKSTCDIAYIKLVELVGVHSNCFDLKDQEIVPLTTLLYLRV
jgi:hypothetical protein